uniref:mucin-4-like isoform X2 n=1 Tax=Myxine glutinosa TaxID=7769 RepID=UPI00358F1778
MKLQLFLLHLLWALILHSVTPQESLKHFQCNSTDYKDCVPQAGGASCSCNQGLNGTCDIDECAGNEHNCDENAICENTKESFTCSCKQGYTGNGTCCKIEKCHKEQCDVNPCNHGGTCVSIESENSTECQYKCDCLVIYEGRDCELGAERVKVAFQQGITPPKVEFAISIIFPNKEYPATQNDQTLLEEEIKDELSTVCKLGDSFAINEFKYTDSNGHLKASFKAYYNYTTNNIDEIYNGSMKKAIEEKCKSLKRNTKKVEQSVEIEQINASELNNFFKCDTTYTGYHIQTNGTAIYCISPCKSNINYCNGGNCSHTPSGPKCSCGQSSSMYQSTGDRCQISTILTDAFFKILFGTLAGILGLALLLGLIAYCIGRQSRSDFFELHTNSDRDG